ncbi:MAG: Swt1 family HEPN domain-containing protein [Chloroflexi bacterium]|nr:Swt1 family HEPN domain-containing protein [Chloroflexota bacterium]
MVSRNSNNRHVIDEALNIFAIGLRPFVAEKTNQKVDADPSALIRLMLERWEDAFHRPLGYRVKNLLYEIRDIRNGWAHNSRHFDDDETDRALDSMERLLEAIGAAEQAAQLKWSKEQYRVARYGGGKLNDQVSSESADEARNRRERLVVTETNAPSGTAYNVVQASRALTQYGYTCITPSYGTQDAQILARVPGENMSIKVRCPGRVAIQAKFLERDLYVCFPAHGSWYLVPHDGLVGIAGETTPWLDSHCWRDRGWYSSANPSKRMLARLAPYSLTTAS